MNRRSFFGTHLYGQIIGPLLAASIVVGVVATIVAVYFLQDLTNKWVTQVAESSAQNLAFRFEDYDIELERIARLIATSEPLVHAIDAGDPSAIRSFIQRENATLGYDGMLVLDGEGRLVAVSGLSDLPEGSMPFGTAGELPESGSMLTTVSSTPMLVAFQRVSSGDHASLVGVARMIDDSFLIDLGVSKGTAVCFYSPEGDRVACAFGEGIEGERRHALEKQLDDSQAIRATVRSTTTTMPGEATLQVNGEDYAAAARALTLRFGDRTATQGYLVSVVSQEVSAQASRTTVQLIAMWSIVAVVALVGLGGWVARRVSDPLVDLAAGARRIADGDFSTKVHVHGTNEVAELAVTFNDMTDSLRERSESLTKKVLELATLYEMSRALGATLDLEELLGSVLDSALRIFDLDLGYVALRERDTGVITIHAIRGADQSQADGAVRSSMSEWVVREGRPLIFNPDAGRVDQQIDSVTGARAALCVPLISPEGAIGAVTIGSTDQDYRFNGDDVRLLSTIANHVTIAIGNIELFTSLQEAYLATVRSLAAAVDAKDSYTRGHSDRVATYSTMIAERMQLSHEQRIALEMAAYLHDIGKIGIPEEILLKPGRLTDEEMSQMRHHPLIGANILKPVAFPWAITPVVRHHHESFDGHGYPAGLRGEEIPLLARILTVADSYEAMTADRPYRRGRSAEDAVFELRACSGRQFDPKIVDVFAAIIEELEESGEAGILEGVDEIAPEEARAIFAALVDGVFSSFRRLGGPRLAANVENEIDEYFAEEHMPFRVVRGRMTFTDNAPVLLDGEVDQMRASLRRIDAIMGRVSGPSLVEHFYTDAFSGFSGRMRYLARTLDFYSGE